MEGYGVNFERLGREVELGGGWQGERNILSIVHVGRGERPLSLDCARLGKLIKSEDSSLQKAGRVLREDFSMLER